MARLAEHTPIRLGQSDSTMLSRATRLREAEEMLQHAKGVRKVPVIIEDGKVPTGYGRS